MFISFKVIFVRWNNVVPLTPYFVIQFLMQLHPSPLFHFLTSPQFFIFPLTTKTIVFAKYISFPVYHLAKFGKYFLFFLHFLFCFFSCLVVTYLRQMSSSRYAPTHTIEGASLCFPWLNFLFLSTTYSCFPLFWNEVPFWALSFFSQFF